MLPNLNKAVVLQILIMSCPILLLFIDDLTNKRRLSDEQAKRFDASKRKSGY